MAAENRNSHYRAIGRWFVEFSGLVMGMRLAIEIRFAKDSNIGEAKIVLGEATADQVANAFFGLCAYVAEPDGEEEKSLAWLREEVRGQVQRRNDFAHGDWRTEEGTMALWRTKGARKEAFQITRYSAAEINEWADSLRTLAQTVGDLNVLCVNQALPRKPGPIRLKDVYRYQAGSRGKRGQGTAAAQKARVTRDGPLAAEFKGFWAPL